MLFVGFIWFRCLPDFELMWVWYLVSIIFLIDLYVWFYDLLDLLYVLCRYFGRALRRFDLLVG